MGFYQLTHLSDVRATFCNKICQNQTRATQQDLPIRSPRRREQVQGSQGFLLRCSAWAARYPRVPAGQMGQLGFYFYIREAATDVDGDQRSDVGNSETIAGNKFMAVKFAVHPFESLID